MNSARAVGDMQRPTRAAPFVRTGLVVLDRLEHGEQISKAPSGVPGLCPRVEISRMAANPYHRVDRTRAAEELAARPVIGITGKTGVGLCPVIPVYGRVEEGLSVTERHLNVEAPVAAAGL